MQYHRGADLNMKVNANFFWQVLTFADLTTVVFILFILSAMDRHLSRRLGACVSLCAHHSFASYHSAKRIHHGI